MSQKETVRSWLKSKNIDLSLVDFDYDINGQTKILTIEPVLKAVIDRLGEDRLLSICKKMEDYFVNKWWERDQKDPIQQGLRQDLKVFLRDMSEYVLWKDNADTSFEQLAKDCDMDLEFLKWWQQEKGFTDQQMLCEHDDTDQFSEDGNWYNSVGVCKKCLADTSETLDYDDNVELVYKAWKRK